jgi:hypothetical protein
MLEHGAGVDADRVGSGDVVIGANVRVGDDSDHDDNRAVGVAEPVAIDAERCVVGAPDQPRPVHGHC